MWALSTDSVKTRPKDEHALQTEHTCISKVIVEETEEVSFNNDKKNNLILQAL